MNFSHLLNQLLGSAQKSIGQSGTADTITKVGGGAAAIGLLSMFLGRKGGSQLAKVGSLAALGSLAYQAYKNYQHDKPQTTNMDLPATAFEPVAHNVEDTSKLILRTMIAAAAADGAIDEREKQLIMNEIGNDVETQQWILQEMARPATVQEIAKQIGDDTALASEIYLAARMVSADLSRKEIVFLAQLAQALKLDDALVEQLEKQAGF
ncbi:MAG TPA: DUF533 domain-containing protein [Pasteurellaceae bacterium]|nr:DUF533 domain-containing protein [Pasteurellaceae bacterium]